MVFAVYNSTVPFALLLAVVVVVLVSSTETSFGFGFPCSNIEQIG